jgi:uncharacterized cupin superfamily protein
MAESEPTPPMIVNMHELPETEHTFGRFGAANMSLTPSMVPRGGKLNVNRVRLRTGQATCPFHYHLREDEVFIVLEGMGVLRYGDGLSEIVPGDCISCPAGTRIAHQIANPYEEDLIYLAIGPHEPHEVCVYPDSDKVSVRGVKMRGTLSPKEYFDDEPNPPRIFELLGLAQPDHQ